MSFDFGDITAIAAIITAVGGVWIGWRQRHTERTVAEYSVEQQKRQEALDHQATTIATQERTIERLDRDLDRETKARQRIDAELEREIKRHELTHAEVRRISIKLDTVLADLDSCHSERATLRQRVVAQEARIADLEEQVDAIR